MTLAPEDLTRGAVVLTQDTSLLDGSVFLLLERVGSGGSVGDACWDCLALFVPDDVKAMPARERTGLTTTFSESWLTDYCSRLT